MYVADRDSRHCRLGHGRAFEFAAATGHFANLDADGDRERRHRSASPFAIGRAFDPQRRQRMADARLGWRIASDLPCGPLTGLIPAGDLAGRHPTNELQPKRIMWNVKDRCGIVRLTKAQSGRVAADTTLMRIHFLRATNGSEMKEQQHELSQLRGKYTGLVADDTDHFADPHDICDHSPSSTGCSCYSSFCNRWIARDHCRRTSYFHQRACICTFIGGISRKCSRIFSSAILSLALQPIPARRCLVRNQRHSWISSCSRSISTRPHHLSSNYWCRSPLPVNCSCFRLAIYVCWSFVAKRV